MCKELSDTRQSCRVVLRSNYSSTTIAREVESESEEQVYVHTYVQSGTYDAPGAVLHQKWTTLN